MQNNANGASGTPLQLKIGAARYAAATQFPYFRIALFSMYMIETEDVPTCGVDVHWRLYYNPRRFEEWSVQEIEGALLHEAMHLIRNHAERAKKKDVMLWNIAADLEINDDLLKSGVALPEGALYPKQFSWRDGLLAERYYEYLNNEQQRNANGLSATLQTFQRCGSGATSVPEPWERTDRENGLSPRRAASIRKAVCEAMQKAGRLPEGHHLWAGQQAGESSISWQALLSEYVDSISGRTLGATDWTYAKPSRRNSLSEVILPALYQPQVDVAVVMDTSGSMASRKTGSAVLTEVAAICHACNGVVRVLSCDSKVHATQQVTHVSEVLPLGGGGTDMEKGISHACRLVPRPAVVIVITDCETPWPQSKPQIPVLVVAIDENRYNHQVPAWAKVVHVRKGKDKAW